MKEITMQPAVCCLYNLGLDLNTTQEVSVTINGEGWGTAGLYGDVEAEITEASLIILEELND